MHLTIVYDGDCGFCRWCRDWLAGQPLVVPVTFRPSSDAEARRRWGHVEGYGDELLVADDDGAVWVGTAAFTMALWATREHRARSYRLETPLARALVHQLSSQRARLAGVLSVPCDDVACGAQNTECSV